MDTHSIDISDIARRMASGEPKIVCRELVVDCGAAAAELASLANQNKYSFSDQSVNDDFIDLVFVKAD